MKYSKEARLRDPGENVEWNITYGDLRLIEQFELEVDTECLRANEDMRSRLALNQEHHPCKPSRGYANAEKRN